MITNNFGFFKTNIEQYKWKKRLLIIKSPSIQDQRYKDAMKSYKSYYKLLKRYCIKLMRKRKQYKDFSIELVGFDGEVKHIYKKMDINKIIDNINNMPMGNRRC